MAPALGALLAHEPIVREELELEVGLRHDPQYKKDPISNFLNFRAVDIVQASNFKFSV